jgi:hypothetical protein
MGTSVSQATVEKSIAKDRPALRACQPLVTVNPVLSKGVIMKVRVWNRTGIDLWSGMVVMNDVVRFVFRPWHSTPANEQALANRIEAGQIGVWDVRDGLPIDPNTGMVRVRAHAAVPFKTRFKASPKGWMNLDVFILSAAPGAYN